MNPILEALKETAEEMPPSDEKAILFFMASVLASGGDNRALLPVARKASQESMKRITSQN